MKQELNMNKDNKDGQGKGVDPNKYPTLLRPVCCRKSSMLWKSHSHFAWDKS